MRVYSKQSAKAHGRAARESQSLVPYERLVPTRKAQGNTERAGGELDETRRGGAGMEHGDQTLPQNCSPYRPVGVMFPCSRQSLLRRRGENKLVRQPLAQPPNDPPAPTTRRRRTGCRLLLFLAHEAYTSTAYRVTLSVCLPRKKHGWDRRHIFLDERAYRHARHTHKKKSRRLYCLHHTARR